MRLKSIPLRDPEIVEAEARTYWRANAEKVRTTSLTSLTACVRRIDVALQQGRRIRVQRVVLLLPAKVAACIRSMFATARLPAAMTSCCAMTPALGTPIRSDTASANVWKPPWWSWSVAITASRSKPPTGNAVTPTTGFISIRLGPVTGPTTTTPTNDPLLGWSVVVSEVSGFASLSTRVYAHAPFVNDEGFGLCIACGCGWRITDFTD